MHCIQDEMDFISRLMKGIAAQFGRKCEVVLHDYQQDYDKTIVQIENGDVTGRSVGECGTNLGLEVLRGTVSNGDKFNYVTQTKDGKILHSTSIYIRNENNDPIGALCINWDVTDMYVCNKALQEIIGIASEKEAVNEVEDKIKGIKFLDSKGAFLIKKAGDKITKFYDISKYTLYSYLEANGA